MDLRAQQAQMDRSLSGMKEAQHLAKLKAQMKAMKSATFEQAEKARLAYEQAWLEVQTQAKVQAMEQEQQEKTVALTMKLRELQLKHDERKLQGDAEGAKEAAAEAAKVQHEMRALDLDRLRIEMERTKAQLEIQKKELERLQHELGESSTPEADTPDAKTSPKAGDAPSSKE